MSLLAALARAHAARSAATCAIVLLSFMPNTAFANLVVNGSFSTGDFTGWSTVAQGLGPRFDAPYGFVADLGTGGSSISQSTPTRSGDTYEIQYLFLVDSFGHNPFPGSPGTIGQFSAFFGTGKAVPENTWQQAPSSTTGCVQLGGFPSWCVVPGLGRGIDSWFFQGAYVESFIDVATSSLTTLSFHGVSCCGDLSVTAISLTDITPVPEPATALLFSAALVALGAVRWKTRRRNVNPS
jgi:hypothetical protein